MFRVREDGEGGGLSAKGVITSVCRQMGGLISWPRCGEGQFCQHVIFFALHSPSSIHVPGILVEMLVKSLSPVAMC